MATPAPRNHRPPWNQRNVQKAMTVALLSYTPSQLYQSQQEWNRHIDDHLEADKNFIYPYVREPDGSPITRKQRQGWFRSQIRYHFTTPDWMHAIPDGRFIRSDALHQYGFPQYVKGKPYTLVRINTLLPRPLSMTTNIDRPYGLSPMSPQLESPTSEIPAPNGLSPQSIPDITKGPSRSNSSSHLTESQTESANRGKMLVAEAEIRIKSRNAQILSNTTSKYDALPPPQPSTSTKMDDPYGSSNHAFALPDRQSEQPVEPLPRRCGRPVTRNNKCAPYTEDRLKHRAIDALFSEPTPLSSSEDSHIDPSSSGDEAEAPKVGVKRKHVGKAPVPYGPGSTAVKKARLASLVPIPAYSANDVRLELYFPKAQIGGHCAVLWRLVFDTLSRPSWNSEIRAWDGCIDMRGVMEAVGIPYRSKKYFQLTMTHKKSQQSSRSVYVAKSAQYTRYSVELVPPLLQELNARPFEDGPEIDTILKPLLWVMHKYCNRSRVAKKTISLIDLHCALCMSDFVDNGYLSHFNPNVCIAFTGSDTNVVCCPCTLVFPSGSTAYEGHKASCECYIEAYA